MDAPGEICNMHQRLKGMDISDVTCSMQSIIYRHIKISSLRCHGSGLEDIILSFLRHEDKVNATAGGRILLPYCFFRAILDVW